MAFAFNLNLSVFCGPSHKGELTMSWIDDEANALNAKELEERRVRELIQHSQYWSALIEQLKTDIEIINNHPKWVPKLAGFPIRFQPPYGGEGYQISKSGFPAVLVEIHHKGSYVDVARAFTENPLSRNYRNREKLQVGVLGNAVVMVPEYSKDKTLVVPQEVSRYLLEPIIESLKITKS